MRCFLWNPRSLCNKLEEFIQLLEDNDIHIAAVCETWLTSSFNYVTSRLRELSYNIHHQHRDSQRGGGVALIFKNNLHVEGLKSYKFKSFEAISVIFKSPHVNNVLFVVIYRCGIEPIPVFLKEFNDLLEILQLNSKKFFICGDFNIHVNKVQNSEICHFNDILNSFNLKQLIQEPTHILGNTLDLLIHNPEELKVTEINITPDSLSDHSIIFFNLTHNLSSDISKTIITRDIASVNIDLFNSDIDLCVQQFLNICNSSQSSFYNSVNLFHTMARNVLDNHAPLIEKTITINMKPKWMDKDFLDARSQRRKLYKCYIRTGDDTDKAAFIQSRNSVNNLVYVKRKEHIRNSIKNCNNSQKELYNICNTLLDKTKSSVLPKSDDATSLASRFNTFFCDKITNIRNCFPPFGYNDTSTIAINPISTLSEFKPLGNDELLKIIKAATIKTSPDDPIPAALLKSCLESMLPALVHLVNASLLSGEMNGLKDSVVTPLLKKFGSDPEVLSNYRPITNVKYLSKLIERAVLPQLNSHMSFNNMHISNQSGYKKYHSCETLLVQITNDILLNLDGSNCTVLLLLDLSAAFDTVDHDILLDILFKEIGLRDTVLKWFISFLRGRRQAISINGAKSEYQEVPFGVPQGSVLGPVLFNIYVRSLIKFLERHGFSIHGYADDHQVYKSFRIEFQFESIRCSLPQCLELISHWMNKFFLKLNAGKSKIMIFSPASQSSEVVIKQVILPDCSYISISQEALNLGVLLDSQLTFCSHVNMIISQGYRALRNVASIRKFLNDEEMKSLVNSIVVTRIDNCNALFDGITKYLITRLQRLQNSCARLIFGKKRRDHARPLLKQLHWLPVQERIIFKIICLVFKCIHKNAPSYLINSLPEPDMNLLLRPLRTRSSYGDRAFSVSGPRYWNALPSNLKQISNFDTFKAQLKHHLFSEFHEYKLAVNRYRNWI